MNKHIKCNGIVTLNLLRWFLLTLLLMVIYAPLSICALDITTNVKVEAPSSIWMKIIQWEPHLGDDDLVYYSFGESTGIPAMMQLDQRSDARTDLPSGYVGFTAKIGGPAGTTVKLKATHPLQITGHPEFNIPFISSEGAINFGFSLRLDYETSTAIYAHSNSSTFCWRKTFDPGRFAYKFHIYNFLYVPPDTGFPTGTTAPVYETGLVLSAY